MTRTWRYLIAAGSALGVAAALCIPTAIAQQAGQNVNVLPSYPIGNTSPPFMPLQPVVAGSTAELQADSLKGDIYLQREVEPVVAASTYNPDHLLAAFGDFRTVDIGTDSGVPGNAAEGWIGYSRSYDRGKHWYGAMVPGFPQGTSSADTSSPLYGLNAGSDAVLATTPGGHFYLGGLFFTRGGLSNVAVMHLRDVPSLDGGDSIQPGKITIIDKGSNSDTGNFEDKPAIVGDIPRNTTDPSACGPVYMAYTIFTGGTGATFTSKIGFGRSKQGKCGEAWDNIQYLNKNYKQNQGTAIAIDPRTGKVIVIWRHFSVAGGDGFPDAIVMATSSDFGNSFSAPVAITGPDFQPFDQVSISTANCASDLSTCPVTFRSNAFPAIAVDGGGNVYVAIQEKIFASDLKYYEPRITIRTLQSGATKWTAKSVIEMGPATGGQQVMPSLTFGAGMLRAMWYDFRSNPRGSDNLPAGSGGYYIAGVDRRMETRVAQSSVDPFATGNPVFTQSMPVSSYLLDSKTKTVPSVPGTSLPAVNRPNLPMYVAGTTGFTGDYITIMTGSPFVATPGAANPFRWATDPGDAPAKSSLAVWTDSRDVVFPGNGLYDKLAWQTYAPPGLGGASCINPGSRDQNVYFAEVKPGVIAGSPATSRQLVGDNGPFERAFPFYVQNPNPTKKFFRLTFNSDSASRPVVGSFIQGPFAPEPQATKSPTTTLDVAILGYSTVSKTLYAFCPTCTASNAFAPFSMGVQEIDKIGGSLLGSSGLTALLRFNNDTTAPFVTNPRLTTQEIHTVSVSNPQFTDPQFTDPQFTDPQFTDPQFTDPQFTDPQFTDPQFTDSQPAGDFVWEANNVGNNASAYSAGVTISQSLVAAHPEFKYKLIITRAFNKPGFTDCSSQPIPTDQIISIIPLNPQFTDPQFTDPQFTDPQFTDPQFTDPQFTDAAFTAVPPADSTGGASAAAATKSGGTGTSSTSSGTAPIQPDKVFIVLRVYAPKGSTPLNATDIQSILANVSTVVTPQAGDTVSNANGTITVTPPTPASSKGFTTTTLTSSTATSTYGTPVTFTATVVQRGTSTPVTDGTVEFREVDATGAVMNVLAVKPVDESGRYSFTKSDFTVAGSPHLVNAVFSGTSTFNGSFSTTLTETVSNAASTTTVTCPPSVTYNGAAQTPCTAVATGSGGLNQPLTVTYSNNTNVGTANASASYAGDANHSGSNGPVTKTFTITTANASCSVVGYNVTYDTKSHTATGSCAGVGNDGTLSGLNLGGTTHTNGGTYNDSWTFTDVTGNYNNTGGPVTDVINAVPTTTAVVSTPNPSGSFGVPVTFTATVSPVSPSTVTPQGQVVFSEGNTTLAGPTNLDGSGQASFTTAALSAGAHTITATFNTNTNFGGSSGQVTQTVTAVQSILFAATDHEEFQNLPNQVSILSVSGSSITGNTLVPTAYPANGLAGGNGFLYTGDPDTNALLRIDYDLNLLASGSSGVPNAPYNEDLAFDGSNLYRAHFDGNGGEIDRLDPSTGNLITAYPAPVGGTAPSFPVGLTFVAQTLWVSRWYADGILGATTGEVGTWDPSTNVFTHKFYTPSLAGGLAYDSRNGVLWVGRFGGCVEPYDLNGNVLGFGDSACQGAGYQPFGALPGNTIDGLEVIAPRVVTFEIPSLGASLRQVDDPYVSPVATFTAEGGGVVVLVQNDGNATSACVPPGSANQLLASWPNSSLGGFGSGIPIRATLAAPLAAPATISVDVQTGSDVSARLTLYDANGTVLATATATPPATGVCPADIGVARGSVTLTATVNSGAVAYAIIDTASGGTVFVIDNFKVQ